MNTLMSTTTGAFKHLVVLLLDTAEQVEQIDTAGVPCGYVILKDEDTRDAELLARTLKVFAKSMAARK
jgi:hypothetical protein